MRRLLPVVAVIALVLLAGCSGAIPGADSGGSDTTESQTTAQAPGDDSGSSDSFSAHFTTDVVAGEQATLKVTDSSGDPVVDADVRVDDTTVGTTSQDGTITFEVPSNDDAIEVQVAKSGDETEFTKSIQGA